MGYLYMTHSLGRPGYAPLAALLCGGVPFVAMRAATAVLADASVSSAVRELTAARMLSSSATRSMARQEAAIARRPRTP